MVPFFISASPKSGVSPQPSKLAKPLQTLVEEQHIREAKPLLDQDEDVSVCVCAINLAFTNSIYLYQVTWHLCPYLPPHC